MGQLSPWSGSSDVFSQFLLFAVFQLVCPNVTVETPLLRSGSVWRDKDAPLPCTEDRQPLCHFYEHQEGTESPSPAAPPSRIPPLGPWSWVHGPLAARSPPVRCVRFIRLTRNSRSGDLGCSLSTQTLKRRVFEARAPRTSTIPLSSRLHLRTSGVAALRRKAASPRPLCGSDFFFLPYLFDRRLPLSIFHIVSWSYRFLLEA